MDRGNNDIFMLLGLGPSRSKDVTRSSTISRQADAHGSTAGCRSYPLSLTHSACRAWSPAVSRMGLDHFYLGDFSSDVIWETYCHSSLYTHTELILFIRIWNLNSAAFLWIIVSIGDILHIDMYPNRTRNPKYPSKQNDNHDHQ